MPKCKTCGGLFHACSSCSLTYNWEWNYCSESCWKKSEEYEKNKILMTLLADSFTPQQRQVLKDILENIDSDYDEVFINILKTPEERERERGSKKKSEYAKLEKRKNFRRNATMPQGKHQNARCTGNSPRSTEKQKGDPDGYV